MKTVDEKSLNTKQIAMPVAIGTLSAFIFSLLLLIVFSLLMALKNMPSAATVTFACISISGGAFGGGLLSARIGRRRGLISGIVTGLLFFVILYLTGLAMGQADLNALLLIKVILSAGFGGIGGIMGVNFKRHRTRI